MDDQSDEVQGFTFVPDASFASLMRMTVDGGFSSPT
jgi:hypothetical protein